MNKFFKALFFAGGIIGTGLSFYCLYDSKKAKAIAEKEKELSVQGSPTPFIKELFYTLFYKLNPNHQGKLLTELEGFQLEMAVLDEAIKEASFKIIKDFFIQEKKLSSVLFQQEWEKLINRWGIEPILEVAI